MKKHISIIIGFSIFFLFLITAHASNLSNAYIYNIGFTKTGSISETYTEDINSFTVNNAGKVTINFNGENIECVMLCIYDTSGQEIWADTPYWNDTTKSISYKQGIELTTGKYYFVVSQRYGYGSFSFKLDFESANETFSEIQGGSNNTLKTASAISINNTYIGQIAINDTVDIYSVNLASSGKISMLFTAMNIECAAITIFDEYGQEIWRESPYWNSVTQQISYKQDIELVQGSYYIAISQIYQYGTYTISLPFSSAYETCLENQNIKNNSLKNADEVPLNQKYTGQIAVNDTTDVYKFNVIASGTISVDFMAIDIECVQIAIFDITGQELWSDTPYWNSQTEHISYNNDVVLDQGTYYFVISQRYNYGTYNFTLISDIANTVIIYDSSASRINGNIVLTVSSNADISSKVLHAALYDNNNNLIDYIIVPAKISSNFAYIIFDDNIKAAYAKVFLWDSLSSITPLVNSETVKIN
ncbi:MAG: hypothetical protein ACI4DP_04085 [Candidatus Ornithomonoglobus sp.]